ncbi:CDP-glycerol glycerophosphotransferase family protein [Neisseria perflava]|uniref:CDP-glycerol glycerophosphotransferase family protein n=1 Tax=Neisseria perflava TaxID=33053 RepID=UPI00209D3FB0|nr:CDP-glycerol glycerophosphotransferase family protein [Neisseria perflava]MCP1659293.1 CDP-glycerol glycerophosphotransferase (TagB/SpsB family) [Neisseria perflava]MCP1772801.1 CDP-glycerol glycerophosphotransferase (TagB/SpsB family) [Neisseria perflava]
MKKAAIKKAASPTCIAKCVNPYKKYVHLIHTGEQKINGSSHLKLWLPEFLRSGEDFLVLTRNLELFNWLRETYPYVDAFYAKGLTDIEKVLNTQDTIKAIYYLSNTGNVIHTIRFNQYKHIFLGHGDSDKSASAHKFFRVYDQIWVAGQAHIDRFKNAGFNISNVEFVKVGRPNLRGILVNNEQDWRERQAPRILYLPTWEGVYEEGNYASVGFAADLLAELYQRFGILISTKFHPSTGNRLTELKTLEQMVKTRFEEFGEDSIYVADKMVPVNELLVNVNIFICDISAVVSECIAANGPIFVHIPQDRVIEISQSDMTYEDYAYTFSNIEELCTQLAEVLAGNDPKASQRALAMDYLMSVEQTRHNEFERQLKAITAEAWAGAAE